MEKERRTKALLLSTLVVVVATLSIAFAAMSRTLSINGIGKMDTASWSVYFDNLSNAKITRGAKEIGKPGISTDKGTVQDINVKLSNPKDEISYTVDIVNDGTIDAEITMIKDIELTDAQKKVFEFKVTYTDTGEVLKDGDLLPKDTTKNITINIKFKDDITELDLPTESQTINLSYQITYTQYDGGGAIVGPNGGGVITEKAVLSSYIPKAMPMQLKPFFNGQIARQTVESIVFLSSNIVPAEYAEVSWDASQNGDGSVMAWYTDNDFNNLYEVYVGGNGGVYAPSDSSLVFSGFVNLVTINFNNSFYPQDITNMYGMFQNSPSLISLDVSIFDTRNVTDMGFLFGGCPLLTSLDVSNFNTSNVTNMAGMFGACLSLTSLDLSKFNTMKVTSMGAMFSGCSSLISLDVSIFDTTNVTDMNSMFNGCNSLTGIDVGNFNTSNVINMGAMFSGCSSLISLDLSLFDTREVTFMGSMFYDCSSLTSLDLSSFDTMKVTSMVSMFEGCSSLISLDLRNADFANVTYYNNMFNNVNPEITRIIVKDETQRIWLIKKFPLNVVLPSEI